MVHSSRHPTLPRAKVGAGHYRTAYASRSGKYLLKVPHAAPGKKVGPFAIPSSQSVLSLRKLGRWNPNDADIAYYRKYFTNMPRDLSACVAKIRRHFLIKGKSILAAEDVEDYTGHRSSTLFQAGKVSNPHFWSKMDALAEWASKNHVPLFSMSGDNIAVKWVSPTEAIPVLLEFKFFSWNRFRLQPWSRLSSFHAKKVARRCAILKKQFYLHANRN